MQTTPNQLYSPYICFCGLSPRTTSFPCPNNCAICIQGVWNPVTILNAPRLPTVQLPTRKVTFSPFAEVHHFTPEHWYPSPPITPQRLPAQLPVIPDTKDTRASPQPVHQSSRAHGPIPRRTTQLRFRGHSRVSHGANLRVSPSPCSVPSPAPAPGAENPGYYRPPPPVPPRSRYVSAHPPRHYRSSYGSRRKLRRFLRFLRRLLKFGR